MRPYGFIYGLYDPETNKLRYIGQTTSSVEQRLGAQISANRKGKTALQEHPGYRVDISTTEIVRMLREGRTKVQIASALNQSPTFVHRRLAQAVKEGFLQIEETRRYRRAFQAEGQV